MVSFFLKSVEHNSKASTKFEAATPPRFDYDEQSVTDLDEVRDELKGISRQMANHLEMQTHSLRNEFKSDMQILMQQFLNHLNVSSPQPAQQHYHDPRPDENMSS